MKKATVKIHRQKDRFITILGKIKDTRTVYGRKEVLITKGKIEDFWITERNILMQDD